ncbi:MAG: polysaccharide deacetylase family protein [Gemmatimonadetes bacterium]|nr:polysaccharide deacetylase family protein [Gemmatimonadota bacterium]
MRAVLTYHSLDPSASPISLSPEIFRRQMRWLANEGPRVVTLDALLRTDASADAVVLSFDDAFDNFRTEALPVLRDLGLPATLGVVTGHVGETNRWGGRDQPGIPTLPLMDWDGLGAAVATGLIEIAAHTRTHPHLSRAEASALADEVQGARADLQSRLGIDSETFVYPYGDLSEAVVRAVATDYRCGLTTRLGVLPRAFDPLRVPRVDMYYFRGPGHLEQWGNPRFRMRLGARRLLRSLREAAGG